MIFLSSPTTCDTNYRHFPKPFQAHDTPSLLHSQPRASAPCKEQFLTARDCSASSSSSSRSLRSVSPMSIRRTRSRARGLPKPMYAASARTARPSSDREAGRQGGSEERLARGGIRYEADKMHLPKETMGDSVVQSSEVSESEASSFASLYLSQPHSLSGSGTGSIFSPSLSLLLSRRTVQRISRAQR